MSAAEGPLSARGSVVGGSSRRVGFPDGVAGSGRRVNVDGGAYGQVGSSSRKALGLQTASSPSMGGGGGGGILSPDQQSATHSAVSMNSIFSEARREIRRGLHRDSAIRKNEANEAAYARVGDGTSPAGHTPNTPKTPKGAAAGAGAGDEVAEESNELTWKSDLVAMREMLESNYVLSVLLLCIPLGVVAHFTGWGGVSSAFILNFLAIIPLAWLLGNATEELALRSNQTLGGLLNATFGNAVELIVSIVALRKGMIKIVQTSLLGSILSNCLLVLGMAFCLGGMKNKVQVYNQKGAHMLSSLLLLASIALVLPAAFVNSFQPHPSMNHLLRISRVTALLMFILYILYLYFQLFTHAEMFDDEGSDNEDEEQDEESHGYQQADQQRGNGNGKGGKKQQQKQQKPLSYAAAAAHGAEVASQSSSSSSTYQASSRARAASSSGTDDEAPVVEEVAVQPVSESMKELSDLEAPHHGRGMGMPASIAEDNESSGSAEHVQQHDEDEEDADDDDDEDLPQMTLASSIALLVAVTLAVAVCSEFLVDSIEEVTQAWGMNVSFVGLILLPIVGNAAEHATAVTVAMKNKMDLAIGVAIGSSTQIALFLIPFITLLGWVIDQPMSLNFSSFETIVLVVSVLMVSALLKNGESNWLQGVMLCVVYIIISTTFWFVPQPTDNPRFQNHHSYHGYNP